MTPYEMLLAKVRQVRRRWRYQVLARGIAIFLAATIALLVLGIWGADLFGFAPAVVWLMRVLTGGAALFTAWYFLYLPLRVRLDDVAVAQYIEETYPQLEDRLVAAMEYGNRKTPDMGMINLLVRDALSETSHVDFSVFLNRGRLAAFGILALGAVAALCALLVWGPSFFPYGLKNLYIPWTEASFESPMRIMVLPGDTEIVAGSDQLIDALLVGFDSPDVRLYRQQDGSDRWNAATMEPDPRGSAFRYLLVDVRNSQRYYAESKGVRSPVYSLKVVEQARVEQIKLTYNFPAYTGMKPQTVDNEGDIAALKGTKMDLEIRLNVPVRSARLLFDDKSTLALKAAGSGRFSGNFVLQRSGSYEVQVEESKSGSHSASPEYDIEAIDDEAPRVTVTRPMRDVRATSVEEVFSETRAEDDIGIGKVELRYSVNGAPEKAVELYSGNRPEPSVTASHTFFLEEFGLQPGDLISYYARAWDGNSATGPAVSSSDIYFIQIRPFQQNYTESQQQSMPGSQGGQEGEMGGGQEALGRQQKDIVSATFKLIRDKEEMDPKEYKDGLESLALVQSRLQGQAQGLADRLRRRESGQGGSDFQKLEEYLKTAIGEMERAAVNLGAQNPSAALPQEQKSLQQLMRVESQFREIQVSFSMSQDFAGRGSQSNAEDLADLFELELNKLKNQYETVQGAEQKEREQKVDEALERLKELAARQQQLNERNRMQMPGGSASASSSSGSNRSRQQQLMEQAEQLRRQLQRLSRERSSPRLNEASNRIQQAIDQMKQALQNNGADSSAQQERALQQLNEAVRRIAGGQDASIKEGLEQASKESGNLVKQQEKIQQELDRLARETSQPDSLEEAVRRSENLVSRKDILADRLSSLENSVRDLSRQARKTRRSTSEQLADAADTIRDRRLTDRIQEGNLLIQNGFYESQQQVEDYIREGLEAVQRQLEAAQKGLEATGEDRIEEAANRARQLSEGLRAMERRASEIQRGQQEERSGSRGQAQRGQQQQGQQQQGQQQGQQAQQQGSQQGQQQGQQAQQQGSQQGQQQGQQQGLRQGQQPGQQQGSQQGRGGRQAQRQDLRQAAPGQQAQNGRDMPGQEYPGTPPEGMRDPRNPQSGILDPFGGVREFSDNASGQPAGTGQYLPDGIRQLNRELEQRLTDARDLRLLMNRYPTQKKNLDEVIDAMMKSRDYPEYGDKEQIALLRKALERMRDVELSLARDLERLKQNERYFISGDSEAPEAYRKLVEEYYKSIAEGE